MTAILSRLERVLAALTHLSAYLAGLFILATAFIICYEIVMRGVFHSPTEWVLEVSTYLILAAGFLGLAITARKRAHVRVDILTSRFSARANARLNAIMCVLAILFFLVFMTESADVVQDSIALDRTSPSTLRFPLFIPELSLVIGSALLLGELVRELLVAVGALTENGGER